MKFFDRLRFVIRGSLCYHWLFFALIISISACNSNIPANQSLFTPVRPDATPTATGDAVSSGLTNSAALINYTHPATRFSINYPQTWEPFERPDGVIFIEPSNQAGYSVFFSDVGQVYSDQELNQYLVTFVAQNFANKDTNFSVRRQEQVTNGWLVAQFDGIDSNLGQAINEIRVKQEDTIVFVLLLSAVEAQWETAQPQLYKLIDSFTALDTTPGAVEAGSTGEEPVWVLVGPTNSKFGFLMPSDWEILQQGEDTVLVALPETEIQFAATVYSWTGTTGDSMAEEAALAYLTDLSAQHANIQNLPPQEFPLSNLAGTTVDFLYTTADDVEIAGSVITAVKDGQVYRVVFTSPAELYDGALQWFNPMLQNFTVLSPEEFIVDE